MHVRDVHARVHTSQQKESTNDNNAQCTGVDTRDTIPPSASHAVLNRCCPPPPHLGNLEGRARGRGEGGQHFRECVEQQMHATCVSAVVARRDETVLLNLGPVAASEKRREEKRGQAKREHRGASDESEERSECEGDSDRASEVREGEGENQGE
jgi:hypothetical protein